MEFRFNRRTLLPLFVLLLLLGGCGAEVADAPEPDAARSQSTGEATRSARQRILFFGDSITAGYGLDPTRAFPAIIQKRIDEEGWPFETVNAGVSGETTAGGLRRIDWALQNPVDVLVLELGANDGLRGLPVAGMKINLRGIIERTREKYPDVSVVLAGMQMPLNLGRQYSTDFREAFEEVAEDANAELVPFLLEDVAGRPQLNQFDGIHPTAKGQEVVADNVWEVLKPVLEKRLERETS
ncbi:MAG TPA: arylesterase [Rhodothermales bacterium]|nr:arylesterase [Rhodothermales bacterium]